MGLARVYLSITTLDRRIASTLEPRAAAPHRRLEAVRELAAAGITTGVMVAPIIPALTDPEIETILDAAAAAGAASAGYVLVRLPHEVKELFQAWLEAHQPARARHVLSLIRQCRDGRLNDPEFGSRMRGGGVFAELIAQRFAKARAGTASTGASCRSAPTSSARRGWTVSSTCSAAEAAGSGAGDAERLLQLAHVRVVRRHPGQILGVAQGTFAVALLQAAAWPAP